MPKTLKVFISYSHRDGALLDELATHLAGLRRQGNIQLWHNGQIAPGDDRRLEVDKNFWKADVILLLVTADYLASDCCYSVEMMRAMARHRACYARVLPVIVRACDWISTPLGDLQPLPRNQVPVTSWSNRDEAWNDVVQGIRIAIGALENRPRYPLPSEVDGLEDFDLRALSVPWREIHDKLCTVPGHSLGDYRAFVGDYRLKEQLSRKDAHETWVATNERTGGEVILKFLARDEFTRPAQIRRFLRHAKIASTIKSPYVCTHIDGGKTEDGTYFLVTERLCGETLAERIRRAGPLSLAELHPFIEHVLLGLVDIHTRGIIHRNLTPMHIFLEKISGSQGKREGRHAERARIISLGLAKAIHIHKDESTVTAITHIDERLGSLYFMPLESLLDSRRPDDRSDIFALGVTVFVTLTGEYPFKRARNILHFYEERASGRRSLSQVTAVSWPAALERFLDRALEEDREKRFQNATDALLAWRAVPWTTEV